MGERPDLVLCDVLMPVVDGRAVAEIMRTDPAFQDIPLVLISAGQETRVAKGVTCAAFVEKPFSLHALVELLGKLLKQA